MATKNSRLFRQSYLTDLTDAQWAAIEPLIPRASKGGRRRHVNMREVVNAIRYFEATGCGWRHLPESFPNRSTVWHYFSIWRKHDLWAPLSQIVRRLEAEEDAKQSTLGGTGTLPTANDPEPRL